MYIPFMSGFKKICFINAALHGWQSKHRILLLIITVIVLIYLHVFVKVFIQHAAMRLDDIYIILVDVSNTIWIIFDHEIFLTIYHDLDTVLPPLLRVSILLFLFYYRIWFRKKKILKNKILTFIQEMYLFLLNRTDHALNLWKDNNYINWYKMKILCQLCQLQHSR